MKPIIFVVLTLAFCAYIRADDSSSESDEDNNGSKFNSHYEVIFDQQQNLKNAFYLNIKTKSLWAIEPEKYLFILVDGASGNGLLVNMKERKGWKLSQSWKASSGDLIKSAKEYVLKIKSFEGLINNNQRGIDLVYDQKQIKWVAQNILVNIIDVPEEDPNISILINMEFKSLRSTDYAALYLSQKDKGVKVTIPFSDMQKIEALMKPILSSVSVGKQELSKIKISWSKIYGYKGNILARAMIFIEEVSVYLKQKIRNVHEGLLFDVANSCSKIVKIKNGKGDSGSGSNESKNHSKESGGSKESDSNESD